MTVEHGRGFLAATMAKPRQRKTGGQNDAMARCRRRIVALLNERGYQSGTAASSGRLLHRNFAKYMGKTEQWLTNVLAGERGLRLVDLDKVAEFFRLPVSDFVREDATELMELTPSERRLIRYLRRAPAEYRDSILMMARILPKTTKSDEDAAPPHKKEIKDQKRPKDDDV